MGAVFHTSDRHGPERITAGKSLFGRFPLTSNCYRIGSTLVDAGAPNQAERILRHLGEGTVHHVLLTHSHEDHVGLASLAARHGATVHAPEASLSVLATPLQLPRYRATAWGVPQPVEARPYAGKVQTPDGVFEIVPTPGHSEDHVALFDVERGWLFSGDAHLGRRREIRFDEALARQLDSLRRLAELDAQRMFPGHGSIVTEPRATLGRTIEFYEDLHRRAWELRGAGASLPRVTRHLLGREGFVRYYTEGEFSRENLARQLLAMPGPGAPAPAAAAAPGERQRQREGPGAGPWP